MTAKNHVGENAVQRLLRQLKGLNRELVEEGRARWIELRLDANGLDVGELVVLEREDASATTGQRLFGGTMEEIEAFLTAGPLDRLLAARADGVGTR